MLGSVAGILGAGIEAERATGCQGHLRRHQVVVGIHDTVVVVVALAEDAVGRTVVAVTSAKLVASKLPAVAARAAAVDGGPASGHASLEVNAEGVAAAARTRTRSATVRVIPAHGVALDGDAIERASVVLARDVLPFALAPGAHAGAVHGSHLGDVVIASDEAFGIHLAERIFSIGVEDRLAVDAGAHHLEVLEVTVAVLGTVAQLDVVDIQVEHVAAVEVTDGHILLTGEVAQVDAVERPGALVTLAARTAVTLALLADRPFVDHRPVARAVVGDEHTEVLGSVAGILGAGIEAEGATGSKGHLRRNEVVVGIHDTVVVVVALAEDAVGRTVVAVASADLVASKLPAIASRVAAVDGGPAGGHASLEVNAEGVTVATLAAAATTRRTFGTPHGPTSAGHVEVGDAVDDLGHHITQVGRSPDAHAVLDGLVAVEFNLHVVFALTEALEGIEAGLVKSDRGDRIHLLLGLVAVGEGHLDAFRAVGAVEQHVDSHTIVIK